MDSDDEDLLAELLDEEAQADIDDEEHLLVLACLAGLLDKAKPRRGGSKPGRRKSKPRQRYEGYCILYSDYFAEHPTQDEAVFRRRFRINGNSSSTSCMPSESSTPTSNARRIAPAR